VLYNHAAAVGVDEVPLRQLLQADQLFGDQPSDKIMRMHAQTAMIENGFVHLPKEAGWLAEYLHELTVFPNGKHDDQVDSTAQMLDWFKQAGREPGGIWRSSIRSGTPSRRLRNTCSR
jgi:phage terminase large subunit-like protein